MKYSPEVDDALSILDNIILGGRGSKEEVQELYSWSTFYITDTYLAMHFV